MCSVSRGRKWFGMAIFLIAHRHTLYKILLDFWRDLDASRDIPVYTCSWKEYIQESG